MMAWLLCVEDSNWLKKFVLMPFEMIYEPETKEEAEVQGELLGVLHQVGYELYRLNLSGKPGLGSILPPYLDPSSPNWAGSWKQLKEQAKTYLSRIFELAGSKEPFRQSIGSFTHRSLAVDLSLALESLHMPHVPVLLLESVDWKPDSMTAYYFSFTQDKYDSKQNPLPDKPKEYYRALWAPLLVPALFGPVEILENFWIPFFRESLPNIPNGWGDLYMESLPHLLEDLSLALGNQK